MTYLSEAEVARIGFAKCGRNVKISRDARIYDAAHIEIGENSRIDDFCVISGRVVIGRHSHITPMCLIAGGKEGVVFGDFCTLAYGVKVFSQSDDYSGRSMVNSMIPTAFKLETFARVSVGRQVVVGAGATIFPGVEVGEGCAVGAMSLVLRSTAPWGIYAGVPASRIAERSKDLLEMEARFIKEYGDDSV